MKRFIDFILIITGYSYESYEHMGICYIKAYLEQNGIDSKIHIVFPGEIEKLADSFGNKEPGIVGFPLYSGNASAVMEAVKIIKERYPKTHITIGGPSALRSGLEILRTCQYVDTVIQGEGELTFLELVERVLGKKNFDGCLGVTYRDSSGSIIQNLSRPLIKNLDELPFPSRDIFDRYPAADIKIVGSRGCFGSCTFCDGSGKPLQEGEQVRFRSAKNIVDEIEYLYNKYKSNKMFKFFFVENTFIENMVKEGRAKVEGIIEELSKRKLNIRFSICCRAETIARDLEVRDYLRRLRDLGLEYIIVGLETGNLHDLKLYGKLATLQDNIDTIRFLREENIYLSFGFIMFNPYSTYETLSQNAKFLYENGLGYWLFPFITDLEVYPAAAIRGKLINDGLMDVNANFLTDIYDYRYEDSRIGELRKCLSNIKPHTSKVFLWEKIGIIKTRLCKKSEERDKYQNLIREIDETMQQENEENYRFFSQCINMSQAGCHIKEIEQFCKQFSKADLYESLNNLYWKAFLKESRSNL